MSEYVFKLPDLGEGTVESEIGEWFVKVGDLIEEEAVVGTMMTDKAAVEVSSPVSGRVVKPAGEPGDMVAVGAPLARVRDRRGRARGSRRPPAVPPPLCRRPVPCRPMPPGQARGRDAARETGRIITSPAIRRRARGAGHRPRTNRRQRRQRPHPAPGFRGPGRRKGRRAGPACTQQRRDPGNQGHRSAPDHRGAHGGGETRNSALLLCRGGGHHRTRGAQTASQREEGSRGRAAHAAALPGYGAGACATQIPAMQCHLRQGPQRHTPAPGRAFRHRDTDTWTASRSPSSAMPKAAISRIWLRKCGASQTRRATTVRKRTNPAASTITITSIGKLGGIASTPVINLPEVGIIGVNRAVENWWL